MSLPPRYPGVDELFDLCQTEHSELFNPLTKLGMCYCDSPVTLTNLRPQQLGQALGQAEIRGDVFIGDGTVIESGALIQGPVWIGATT